MAELDRRRVELPDATVVTGAAGWFGRALLHALTDEGAATARPGPIRALVREPDDAGPLKELPGVEPVVGDVTRPRTLTPLFAGLRGAVDVIHAAGVIHPDRIDDFEEINARGTRNVLTAASTAAARRVVHVSSNSPFGANTHPTDRFRNEEPFDPYYAYGRSKMRAELHVAAAVDRGLDVVIVRPPWFYGPYQPARQTAFFTMVRRGRFPIIGDGSQQRSMVYVDNLVQGVIAAELTMTEPGRAWWIADARPYPMIEIVETVGHALAAEGYDVRPNRLRLPAIAGRLAERADGALQRIGRYVQSVHVLGELDKTIACDVSAAVTELGYHPEIELAEGMRRAVRWCRAEGMTI